MLTCLLFTLISAYRSPLPSGYLILNDIHIHETYKASTEHLKWLCGQAETLKRANVQFMVLNGDLTDSGAPLLSLLGPGQRENEWKILFESLEKCVDHFPVFPLAGNHDRFMVETYDHVTNAFEREFSEKVFARQKTRIDRFQGSYLAEISDRYFFFLDNSPFGINRHFWGRVSSGQLDWLQRKLGKISCARCVTLFSHYPTGTLIPSDRKKLLEVLGRHHEKITAYHSGHIHGMFGSRAFTLVDLQEATMAEFSFIDFVSSGAVRWMPLEGLQEHPVDLRVKDMKMPLIGSTRVDGKLLGVVISAEEAVLTDEIDKHPKSSATAFKGWQRRWFLEIYEVMHYMAMAIYIVLIGVLYMFWKYNKNRVHLKTSTPVINNLIVIFGLLMPVMPWAIGYGWPSEDGGNEVVIAGVWGLISLRTGERREMDLMTLQVIPLLIRTGFKCLMIYTSRSNKWLGKAIHYFSMSVIFLITVVGVKLLVLTYGPFLFLSPLVIWELICWGRKFQAFYLDKIKKHLRSAH